MKKILSLLLLAGSLAVPVSVRAGLATAWHIPDNNSDLGVNMRNPEFEIGTNTTVTCYSGLWKWNSGMPIANQTGGWLVYKSSAQSAWSSNALTWYTNTAANQYWSGTFSTAAFGPDDVVQYYFLLLLDGSNGVTNTCVYGGDDASATTGSPAVAAASPFTLRNRPAWLYHNGNRTITANPSGTTSQVSYWMEIGYEGKDGTVGSRWADHACVYYTTDGSPPSGSLGVGSGTTQVAPMNYDHEQTNTSLAGNAMWWVATVSNTPNFTPVNYVIGAWNSANDEQKFADYNAVVADTVFSYTNGAVGVPVLTVNGVNADYTIDHLFLNEVAGDSLPISILFAPNATNVVEADVFSNLNRRNRANLDANGDGVADGILPPDGNLIATGDDSNYYKAYAMSPTGTAGQYGLTLSATNCGAYRLTARYRLAGNTNWYWYSSDGSAWRGDTLGRRDHSLVVSPFKARQLTLYELDALTQDAQNDTESGRGTFADLDNGPGSWPYDPVTNRFNLAYFQKLGVNCLWFQPIHPIGVENRLTDPTTGQPYTVGSPYAVKNYFQINPLLGTGNTRAEAMQEFTNFVAAADAAGMNVMLDEPFSDAAWDLELDALGTNYFAPGVNPTNAIAGYQPLFFSRTNEYDQRAVSANNVAVAPDRDDFGKWDDTAHIYSGRYAAQVPNDNDTTNYLSEADWFDYSVGNENSTGPGNGHFDQTTQNVWRYYAGVLLYWLNQTGCPTNTPANQTYKGIDGLRADFGQGLSPQCWEYIINTVRCQKWDFVFMCEALDGGVVTYRASRDFDILEENLLFDLQSAAVASDYRNAFDARRESYGTGLVLLNNTSHDEEAYADPYEALIRYMACSTIDGLPMIFYGEELGISTSFGFDQYQTNSSGDTTPQTLSYNDLQPICNPANRTYGLDQLGPVYAAINRARLASPALGSSNRYYLNQLGSETPQSAIFSVAKYQTPNGAPNFNDVVLAFTTLDRNNSQSGTFDVNITQNGSNLFGIQPARLYNVKNIGAYTNYDVNRNHEWLWSGGGIAGSNLLANGIYVALNPVPASNNAWTNAPFEAQYLKLYDVTPPPAPASVGLGGTNNYVVGNVVTFTWPAVVDTQGGVSAYQVWVGTNSGGSNVFAGTVAGTTLTVTNLSGTKLYATVSAINNAGIASTTAATSAAITLVNPSWIPVAGLTAKNVLSWSSVSGEAYQVWSTTNLSVPFTAYGGMQTAASPVLTYTNHSTNAARYFRIQLYP